MYVVTETAAYLVFPDVISTPAIRSLGRAKTVSNTSHRDFEELQVRSQAW